MVSGAVTILLTDNRKLHKCTGGDAGGGLVAAASSQIRVRSAGHEPFLRIPPFPGAKLKYFSKMTSVDARSDDVAGAMRGARVGGTYWAARPALPAKYVLVASASAVRMARKIAGDRPVVLWDRHADGSSWPVDLVVRGECDPWHMLQNASAFVSQVRDELRIIAGLLEVPCFDTDGACGTLVPADVEPAQLLAEQLADTAFENPFTGEPMGPLEAIALCGFWRDLIDSNRDISGGIGFAFWKQGHVAPLLWNGSGDFNFIRSASGVDRGDAIAVWRSKASSEAIAELESAEVRLVEVEDGFLRSRGLGADCIPPLSLTVDRLAAYFDPARPSEIERLLQDGNFDGQLLERARELRRLIVEAGLGKYGQGRSHVERPAGARRHVLVPGQVEDDRAVIEGGCGLASNLELLKRARQQAPDAYILYKPHPDVVAGHRRGSIPQSDCLQFADEIVGDVPISSLIDMVDEIHTNTSLAGFEALLRTKSVTTYGVPFYAGWGLTRDLGPVPARRTRTRTVDELAAAVLLLYPRYLDPITGLPCPAEVIVSRLSEPNGDDPGPIVILRRLQGRFVRRLRSFLQ